MKLFLTMVAAIVMSVGCAKNSEAQCVDCSGMQTQGGTPVAINWACAGQAGIAAATTYAQCAGGGIFGRQSISSDCGQMSVNTCQMSVGNCGFETGFGTGLSQRVFARPTRNRVLGWRFRANQEMNANSCGY